MTQNMKGILWFVLSLFISSLNDVVTKYLSSNLPSFEVVFARYAFSIATLLPFMLRTSNSFHTSRLPLHMVRGGLLFGGIFFWCEGLKVVKVTVATVITFAIPIFVLVLAAIFIKERLTWPKVLATSLGFIGIIVVMRPTAFDTNLYSMLLIAAAIMFASLDVINKKFISHEPMLSMIFYSSLFTAMFSAIPAFKVWVEPSSKDILLFIVLGAGANLILYCLLKAFTLIEVSRVAPYRYSELLFSSLLGYIVFKERPDVITLVGAVLIVCAVSLITFIDSNRKTVLAK